MEPMADNSQDDLVIKSCVRDLVVALKCIDHTLQAIMRELKAQRYQVETDPSLAKGTAHYDDEGRLCRNDGSPWDDPL